MRYVVLLSLFLIPAIFLIIGVIFYFKPPRRINYFVGYRTASSMSSQEAWEYAQKLTAKGFLILSVSEIIFDLAVFLPFFIPGKAVLIPVYLILMFVNVLPIIPMVIIIDRKLYKHFGSGPRS